MANNSAGTEVLLGLDPGQPTRLVAGVADLPAIESVVPTLQGACGRYACSRIAAPGD